MAKERLDVQMVALGLAPSREKARALILAGGVLVNGHPAAKAGESVAEDAKITVKQDDCPFVSRGGKKLEKAMASFQISLENRVTADIGASTGGFTDCMLQHGAKRVYAVDVGYGQLDWKLRNHPSVVVMERTNARYLEADAFSPPPDFASVDVSFISLKLIFPALRRVGVGELVTLIKPQFEAGREKVGKHGVVREASIHQEVIEAVLVYAQDQGYAPAGLDYSPIKGPGGNIEYLAHFFLDGEVQNLDIVETVRQAHTNLNA